MNTSVAVGLEGDNFSKSLQRLTQELSSFHCEFPSFERIACSQFCGLIVMRKSEFRTNERVRF